MRISTSKYKPMVLSRKRVDYPLWVGGESFPPVEEFKCLGVLYVIEGRMEREIDRQTGTVLALMRKLKRSVLVKRELTQKAKLST